MIKKNMEQRKKKKKIILTNISVFFVCLGLLSNGGRAQAVYPVADSTDIPFDTKTSGESTINASNNAKALVVDKKAWDETVRQLGLTALKKEAIRKVNDMTKEIVTKGNGGKPYLVTDWNQYLITGPQQEATVYVNSLLDSTLRGRGSAANYSNSGHYSYLEKQAKEAINPPAATGSSLNSTGNPRDGMFKDGNMKTFNEVLGDPSKNQFALSAAALQKQEEVTKQKQMIAEKEQTNGFIPKKDAMGNIMTPAAVFENTFNSASGMANSMVANATQYDEVAGAVVNFLTQAALKPLKDGLVHVGSSNGVTQLKVGVNGANSGINSVNKWRR